MEPSHVLVPLDGSPLADDALVYALSTFDCRVTVLNVVRPLDSGMSEGGVIGVDDERMEAGYERAEQILERAKQRASEVDRTVEIAVEAGDPAEEILGFTAQHNIDHIVMGSHGEDRSRIARRLLGTVATAVVGEAPVTVTVVR